MSNSPDPNCSYCEGTGYDHVYEHICDCRNNDSDSSNYLRHQPDPSSTSKHSTSTAKTTPVSIQITVVFLRIFGHLFLFALGLFFFYLGAVVGPGIDIGTLFGYTGIIILVWYAYKILSFILRIFSGIFNP